MREKLWSHHRAPAITDNKKDEGSSHSNRNGSGGRVCGGYEGKIYQISKQNRVFQRYWRQMVKGGLK